MNSTPVASKADQIRAPVYVRPSKGAVSRGGQTPEAAAVLVDELIASRHFGSLSV